jgi:NifU-like protein involved in Fe-S cluster formation
MYSDRLRELFHSREHAGKLEEPTHYGQGGTPGQGPFIQLWLRVEEDRVRLARFKTYGCPAAIACAEAVCRLGEGAALHSLSRLTVEEIEREVDGVPEEKQHCSRLAAEAAASVAAVT